MFEKRHDLKQNLGRTRRVLARFVPFLRPRKAGLFAASAVLLLETAISLAQPWPLALTLDYVLGGAELPSFVPGFLEPTGALLAAVAFLSVVVISASRAVAAFRRYLLQKLGQQTVFDIRERLYGKVHDLGLDYHGKRRTGDTITRVTSDVKEVRTMLVDSVVEIASSVFILVGMLVVMVLLSWQLTLVALVVVPFLFFAVRRYRGALVERMRVVRQREGAIASVVQESVTGIRAVKLFAREEDEMRRFRDESQASLKASVQSALIEAKFSLVLGLVGGLGTALVLYFGARQVLAGELSVGQLSAVIFYLGLLLTPLWTVSRQLNQIGQSLVSGERIMELLEDEPTVKESPNAVPAPRFAGRVAFEGVHLAYDEDAGEVLSGMSFEAEPGERVALVGVSGAGKTTVTSLLARLYDPQAGRVLMDGRDVRGFTVKSLRNSVTFVPQKPLLFRATVAENVAYGRAGANREEVEEAARRAGADGFVRELPESYDTVLSERGEDLSGGQRQRLSIARAMLRDTPVLVLDEPEAGLDVEIAGAVDESWRELTAGRTTFIIAHELRLVRDTDRVLVIDGGRVAESGTHDELLEAGGIYARLHALQQAEGVES